MNNNSMLEFLMENDVTITCHKTGYSLTADEAFVLGGEFVVYDGRKHQNDLYRGIDLEEAMKVLQN